MIDKINELQPDAVIHLGDMIAGYGLRRTEKQWDEFDQLVSKIKAPFFRVPGNHDIYSQKSLEIYRRRYGQTYYSVDLRGYHLIFLWNVEENRLGHLSRQQYNWLKADLGNQMSGQEPLFFCMSRTGLKPVNMSSPLIKISGLKKSSLFSGKQSRGWFCRSLSPLRPA